VIGAVWFLAAAVFDIYVGRTSFAIGWVVKGPASNAASLATIYFIFIFTVILLIGWTVPVGIGIYRLLRH
jgi:hypothetical protein